MKKALLLVLLVAVACSADDVPDITILAGEGSLANHTYAECGPAAFPVLGMAHSATTFHPATGTSTFNVLVNSAVSPTTFTNNIGTITSRASCVGLVLFSKTNEYVSLSSTNNLTCDIDAEKGYGPDLAGQARASAYNRGHRKFKLTNGLKSENYDYNVTLSVRLKEEFAGDPSPVPQASREHKVVTRAEIDGYWLQVEWDKLREQYHVTGRDHYFGTTIRVDYYLEEEDMPDAVWINPRFRRAGDAHIEMYTNVNKQANPAQTDDAWKDKHLLTHASDSTGVGYVPPELTLCKERHDSISTYGKVYIDSIIKDH